ncbi:unnamed protein product, partial [Gulo gulo]
GLDVVSSWALCIWLRSRFSDCGDPGAMHCQCLQEGQSHSLVASALAQSLQL